MPHAREDFAYSKFEALQVSDGVLSLEGACYKGRWWQVVFPRALQEGVLKTCHGSTGAGHFGVSKTLCCLCQGFYWGQFKRDVDLCAAHKGPPDQSHAPAADGGGPMERVAVDIMGQFPRMVKGSS